MAKKKSFLKRPAARTRQQPKPRAAPKPVAAKKPDIAAPAFVKPAMKPGEEYSGILVDQTGKPTAHLIEIAIRDTEGTQEEQIIWAKEQGGELPDLQEGALLYANRKHAHKARYYWTREPSAGHADYAWLQTFGNGHQSLGHKGSRYLACAVRRVAI